MAPATITTPARSFASMLCVMVLAGILISPAVPSPPTVVAGIYAPSGALLLALWAAVCGILLLERGIFGCTPGLSMGTSATGSGPAFLPLRR